MKSPLRSRNAFECGTFNLRLELVCACTSKLLFDLHGYSVYAKKLNILFSNVSKEKTTDIAEKQIIASVKLQLSKWS